MSPRPSTHLSARAESSDRSASKLSAGGCTGRTTLAPADTAMVLRLRKSDADCGESSTPGALTRPRGAPSCGSSRLQASTTADHPRLRPGTAAKAVIHQPAVGDRHGCIEAPAIVGADDRFGPTAGFRRRRRARFRNATIWIVRPNPAERSPSQIRAHWWHRVSW